jgi:predicted phage terminase large subunit-like protein
MANLANLDTLPDEVLKEILALTEAKNKLEVREKATDSFMTFAHHVYENFIEGEHHRIIAEKLERVARGELKRLIINMPPRHSKSEFASFLMPAWFLGRNPKLKIIQATHNTELAVRFGRKVRDLIDDPAYKEIFPSTNLKEDNKGAGKWGTDKGGEYFAAGVGAAVTGRGADLFIIDDPHSEQDAMSESAFDNAYEWYTSGPRQRLQPGGAIILVMCMTGDTPVLMANGIEKPLRDIRPGDIVATYEDGRLSLATINNWQSSGVDSVFKVLTQSGRILRANERHPFLVMKEGSAKWDKLRDLKPGMELVSLQDATDRLGQKQSPGSVRLVKAESPTTEKIRTLLVGRSDTMESGSVLNAQTLVAQARRLRKGFAALATKRRTLGKNLRLLPEHIALSIATESLLHNTRQWFSSETIDAMFAAASPYQQTPALTGAANFVSTTATTRARSVDSCATTVTLPSGTVRTLQRYGRQPRTSSFTTDTIVSITPDGEEEVFDVEVDRTENFIANGVVSHNTRWGKKDLTGRLLANQSSDPMADQWEVVEFPALLPSGRPLWPEFWDKDALLSIKASLPLGKWAAQWQQQPTSEGSAIVRKEWWRQWEKEKIPPLKYIIQAYDTAFSKKETADYSAITTWGIFEPEEGTRDNIILLDAQRGRWNFPELKEVAFEEHQYWEPDMVIVEAKATGKPLIDELRARGIPALGFSPGRRAGGGGVDKTTRMHMVSPLFEAGLVWAPEDKRFAEEVIEEVTSFPNGDHDDFCDSMTLALIRFRQGGFVTIHDEEQLDFADQVPRKREYY